MQTFASTYGKAIHPDRCISLARNNYFKRINSNELIGNGRDSIIYSYSSPFTSSEIDDMFFLLQTKQRMCQAEFNGFLHTIEETLNNDHIQKAKEYSEKYSKYTAASIRV